MLLDWFCPENIYNEAITAIELRELFEVTGVCYEANGFIEKEFDAIRFHGVHMPHRRCKGYVLDRIRFAFTEYLKPVEILHYIFPHHRIIIHSILGAEEDPSFLKPPFCHGFDHNIYVVRMIKMLVSQNNPVKVGKVEAFLCGMYPDKGAGTRIDVKVRLLVVNQEACCGPQLGGYDKARPPCSKKLYKTLHYNLPLWYVYFIESASGCQMDEEHFVMYESSIGYIVLVTRNGNLTSLDVTDGGMYEARKMVSMMYPEATESMTFFKTIRTLLDRYLQGREVDFDVEVDTSHLGTFTQKVLNELRNIPYGETRTYGWLAKKVGKPGAARAVGQALKRNPIPIIIPCHRVIRDDGTIGGFSMGVNIKERLLALEGVHIKKQ